MRTPKMSVTVEHTNSYLTLPSYYPLEISHTPRQKSLCQDFGEIAALLTNPTAPRLSPPITHSLRPLNYHHNHISPTRTPDP